MAFEPNITLNKIAYSISHTLGLQYNTYLIEKIKFDAIGIRAMLTRRDMERNGISRQFLQSLGCIPLVCADLIECCNLSVNKDTLRTDRKIPAPLRTKDSDSFYYVGYVDKSKPFAELAFEDVGYLEGNRYTSKSTYYVYMNQYIYIINPPTDTFKYINVTSIFGDPRQVSDFDVCEGDCYNDDSPFPMSEDLLPLLERELLNMYAVSRPVEDGEVRINNN